MISIINYGSGNIRALTNIYGRLGIAFTVVSTPQDLKGSTHVLLPGVGAFDQAMGQLDSSGFRPALEELILGKQVPVLGICVGMQILAQSSDEGLRKGLNWIPGHVRRIDESKLPHATHLPHMGWNDVVVEWPNKLFKGLEKDARFYFLHSYYFECLNDQHVVAVTHYGTPFACAVHAGNIWGVQFHPEKSHRWGVQLLKNFSEL